MAGSLNTCSVACWSNETLVNPKKNGSLGLCPSVGSAYFRETYTKDFMGKSLLVSDQKGLSHWNIKAPPSFSVHAQASFCVSRAMRWWEKTLRPNMVEINSAQQLVDSLSKAGDRLVIVDFYSPGCGGCKALHPKICQLAESNPDAIFLKVNYEELRSMCHSLHIHVLPFFRFYRGAEGRLCSFSCTNATIKKFKDALAKYGTDRSCFGPAKGLDESEILSLASMGEISKDLPFPSPTEDRVEDLVFKQGIASDSTGKASNKMGLKEEAAVLVG